MTNAITKSRKDENTKKTANRRWLWYFALLTVLGISAITIPWIYNVWQQLRPEQLASARALWKEKGPKDYDLEYVSKEDEKPGTDAAAGPEIGNVSVRVRDGQVESATRNGLVLPPSEAAAHRVEGLFDLIQSNLEHDGQPGQSRTYAHAQFDKNDGHPIHYVRRVMGSRQRLEIIIQLNLPGETPAKKPAFPAGK